MNILLPILFGSGIFGLLDGILRWLLFGRKEGRIFTNCMLDWIISLFVVMATMGFVAGSGISQRGLNFLILILFTGLLLPSMLLCWKALHFGVKFLGELMVWLTSITLTIRILLFIGRYF